MNYYIFLSYNFREIDNDIFDLIINPRNIIIIYIKPKNNYIRKNIALDEAWDLFAIELLKIGIPSYEFNGTTKELDNLITIIKKSDNKNIILKDTPRLLFPPINKEYKLCKPFFNYQIKNNPVNINKSESFFTHTYSFSPIEFSHDSLQLYKKKKIQLSKKNIQNIWKDILESDIIPSYAEKRDYLDAQHTTCLSSYINSGQISVRQIWLDTIAEYGTNHPGSVKFLSELGWRDFAYHQFHNCPTMTWENINPRAKIIYKEDEKLFNNWKEGKTGCRIIDAGMNQLRQTGWICNRIRMLVASFLTKNLKISWQKGAEYFLEQLIDADPIINALNWQWVAGTGTDYMPHFRIFNPYIQAKKYDPHEIYQNKWAII